MNHGTKNKLRWSYNFRWPDAVILLIIGSLALALYYKPPAPLVPVKSTQPVEVDFLAINVKEASVDEIKLDDGFWELETNSYIGKIAKIDSRPYQKIVATEDGQRILAEVPGYREVLITVKGEAAIKENQVRFGDLQLYAGLQTRARTREWNSLGTFLEIRW